MALLRAFISFYQSNKRSILKQEVKRDESK